MKNIESLLTPVLHATPKKFTESISSFIYLIMNAVIFLWALHASLYILAGLGFLGWIAASIDWYNGLKYQIIIPPKVNKCKMFKVGDILLAAHDIDEVHLYVELHPELNEDVEIEELDTPIHFWE